MGRAGGDRESRRLLLGRCGVQNEGDVISPLLVKSYTSRGGSSRARVGAAFLTGLAILGRLRRDIFGNGDGRRRSAVRLAAFTRGIKDICDSLSKFKKGNFEGKQATVISSCVP